ncbi:hypothetical protein D3C81_2306860 [compost metagenome]
MSERNQFIRPIDGGELVATGKRKKKARNEKRASGAHDTPCRYERTGDGTTHAELVRAVGARD